MTKNTMNTILTLIADIDTPEAQAVREAVTKELNKGAEKAQANHDLYDSMKALVFGELSIATNPVTIGELFESLEGKLPAGFTKSKLQYAVTRLWIDELTKVEGKVNSYAIKA